MRHVWRKLRQDTELVKAMEELEDRRFAVEEKKRLRGINFNDNDMSRHGAQSLHAGLLAPKPTPFDVLSQPRKRKIKEQVVAEEDESPGYDE